MSRTAPNCEVGANCGDSCISKSKQCQEGKSAEVSEVTTKVASLISETASSSSSSSSKSASSAEVPAKKAPAKRKPRAKKPALPGPDGPITLDGWDVPEKDDLYPLVKKYDKLGFFNKEMDVGAELEKIEAQIEATPKDSRGLLYSLNKRADQLHLLKTVQESGPPEKAEEMRETLNEQYALSLLLERASTGTQYKKFKELTRFAFQTHMNDHIRVFYDEPKTLEPAKGNESLRGKVNTDVLPEVHSKGLGHPVPEYFRNFVEEAAPIVNISPEALMGIDSNDGQFKNMYENDTVNGISRAWEQDEEDPDGEWSGPEFYARSRMEIEDRVMGVPQDADASKRPNYGIVENPQRVRSLSKTSPVAEAYGGIQVQLKQEVKERSTVTVGDSFKDQWMASPALDPKELGNNSVTLSKTEGGASPTEMFVDDADYGSSENIADYVELQIFGGINLATDVELLRLPRNILTPEIEAIASKYGIKLEIIEPWPERKKS